MMLPYVWKLNSWANRNFAVPVPASFAIQMQLNPSFQTGIKCVLMNNEKLNSPYSSLCAEINMTEKKDSLGCQINQHSATGL